MIIEKLEKKEHFTATEKKLADYILNHLEEIPHLSARNLGMRSYTSKATVIRFCQRLEFTGYEAFKEKLEAEVVERSKIKLLLEQEPVNKDTSLSDILQIVPNMYLSTIQNINLELNEYAFKKIISNIRKASTVDIYGFGVTYTCATTAKFKLRSLGINCNTYSGINEHYIFSTRRDRNKVAIVLSFTGGNKAMVDIADYLQKNKFYVIGIGGNESTELETYCDEYIKIAAKQLVLSMEVISPFMGITYAFDLIFTTLLVADFEKNVDVAIEVINSKKEFLSNK